MHNINFAYARECIDPFIPDYIMTFVIGFSGSSHISEVSFKLYTVLVPPTCICVHTSHWICANLRNRVKPSPWWR